MGSSTLGELATLATERGSTQTLSALLCDGDDVGGAG